MRWQRNARWALAIFVIALVGGIYVGVGRRPKPQPTSGPASARTDPNAVMESAGGAYTITGEDGRKTSISYRRILEYPDGRARLIGVERAEIPQRGGRLLKLKADEAEIGPKQSWVTLKGHVELQTSDNVTATTDEASYAEAEGIVKAPGPVRFTRGRVSGSGVGMTYDQHRDVLWLLSQAKIDMAPDARGRGALSITAGAAGLARADHYARFEKDVTFQRDGQTISAAGAVAYLSDDQDRVQSVELRGGSRILTASAAPGTFRSMTARDINLEYAPEGQALERAVASGAGSIEVAGQAKGLARRVSAEWLDLRLAPDGTTVTSLSGRDRVRLDLPAGPTAPARTILSGALGATGAPETGITSAAFSEGVEFRESGKSETPLVARASGMLAQVKPGFGDIESARFVGGVRFEQGTMSGRASEGQYGVGTGQLTLVGNDEKTGAPPQVVDDQATIKATRIVITLDGQAVAAEGAVNTLMRPARSASARPTPGGDAAARSRQGLFTDKEPTQAMADSLAYDGKARKAVYTGKVRLWQDSTRVEGDRIVVDDERGDLSASGSVRTAMLVEQVNDTTKKPEKVPTTGRGVEFVYKDESRQATYTKEAHVVGPQGDLGADRIELFLGAEGGAVERLEAYSAVRLQTPDGRVATGARMSYFAADERYVMGGAPVKVVDACASETTGKSLTFFRSADRIIVDGNEETRTQTKSSGKCPGAVKL